MMQPCPNCGAEMPAEARFCAACGAPAPAPAPAPAAPATCASCGAPLREGAQFCRQCGTAVAARAAAMPATPRPAPTAPPGQPQQLSTQGIPGQLKWSSIAAAAGLFLALISVSQPWLARMGPFDSRFYFRMESLFDSATHWPVPMDGIVVVLASLAAFGALAAHLGGRLSPAAGRLLLTSIGVLLAALALVEMKHVTLHDYARSDIDPGLYLLLFGGALTAASPWIPGK